MNFSDIKTALALEFENDTDAYAYSDGGSSCGEVKEVA